MIEIKHWRNRKPPWFLPLSGQTPEQWREECERRDFERERSKEKRDETRAEAKATKVRICQGKGCDNVLSHRKKKFCCVACRRSPEGLTLEERICHFCEKPYMVPPSQAQKCCGISCARKLYERKKKAERDRGQKEKATS